MHLSSSEQKNINRTNINQKTNEMSGGREFKMDLPNSNHQTPVSTHVNVDKNGPNSKKIKTKGRRELGNRGYVKKMREIPFLGITCAILYAFFMSSSVALLRTISIHPIAVLIYRSIIQGTVFLCITFYNRKTLAGVAGERWPVAGRAWFGMLNQLTWYISIKYISLTDSSAIYYSAPVFVTVLAFFMLGESFGFVEFTSVLVTLVGVTLISKPGFLPFFAADQSKQDISLINQTMSSSSSLSSLPSSSPSSSLSTSSMIINDMINTDVPIIDIHNQTTASPTSTTQLLISTLNSTSNSLINYTTISDSLVASTTTSPDLFSINLMDANLINDSIANDNTAPIDTSSVVWGISPHVIGMSLAFAGAITFALTNISLRKMRKTPTEVTATWFSIVTLVTCTPLAFYMKVMRLPESHFEWIVVLLVGVFSTLGQVAFTLALKIEKAGPVSVAQTLNIVIVLFYQIVFFHEPINGTSLAGVILIIASVILIGLKDTFMNQRLMVRVIKRIRRQGQFDLHGTTATIAANHLPSVNGATKNQINTLQSVHIDNRSTNNSNQPKLPLCTCYTIPNRDFSGNVQHSASHLQVPNHNSNLNSTDQSAFKAKLTQKSETQ